MDQNGGKNIAFPTALLIIRILCIPELVSQLDIEWVITSTLNYLDFSLSRLASLVPIKFKICDYDLLVSFAQKINFC